jgi:hypothetical protein
LDRHTRYTVLVALSIGQRDARKAAVDTLAKLTADALLGYLPSLLPVLEGDSDEHVRQAAAKTVGKAVAGIEGPAATASAEVLVRLLHDQDKYVRLAAVQALIKLSAEALRTQRKDLTVCLEEGSRDTKLATLEVISRLTGEDVAPYAMQIARLANDADPLIKYQAKMIFARPHVDAAVSSRLALLNATQRSSVQAIASRRGLMPTTPAQPPVILEYSSPNVLKEEV